MKTYYVVIESQNDPRAEKIVGVYDGLRWKAEEAKLNFQQDRAASYNIDREKAFESGWSCPALKSAEDFETYYTIKQVHQHE